MLRCSTTPSRRRGGPLERDNSGLRSAVKWPTNCEVAATDDVSVVLGKGKIMLYVKKVGI